MPVNTLTVPPTSMTPTPTTTVPTIALRRPPPLPRVFSVNTLHLKTGNARPTTSISIHSVGTTTTARQHTHAPQNSALTTLRRVPTTSDTPPHRQRRARHPPHHRPGRDVGQQRDHHEHQGDLGQRLHREVGEVGHRRI